LVYLCQQLHGAGKKMEAKGIFNRNRLRAEDFEGELGNELKAMKYEKAKDTQPIKDMFEPISMPADKYLRMPTNIKIEFIDKEDKIHQLEDLKGQKFIGVDAEWRPMVHRWMKNKGPAIL
jgi:hypothetical protein